MSEINLNEGVQTMVEDATVITVPIDDTLTQSGEAADAKAVGDALALKADLSQITEISVNGETPDEQGAILLDASDIPMTEEAGADSVYDAIEAAAGRTADDIAMSSEDDTTIAEAIAGIDDEVVKITEQTLTSEQQNRVRENIGAASSEVNDRIDRVNARMSLILGENATSSAVVYNTYNGRKFSDYSQLLFILYTSKTDKAIIRDSVIIPTGIWISGKTVQLIQLHGAQLGNISGVGIDYNSDTSVSAYTLGAGQLVGFEIQGYMKP